MTHHHNHTAEYRKPKQTKFIETVRLIRRQQDILEQRGDAVSLSVFDKLEDIMNGVRGITFTPQERGRQEAAFKLAQHQLRAEDVERNWDRYETCVHVTNEYTKAAQQQEQRQQEVQA